MKINQAAELAGITKKNIRFYEEQGLVDPARDPQNGYREYNLDDVRQLERVKLLRQLGIPCESIRRMMTGELSLNTCMQDRLRDLDEAGRSIGHMKTICGLLAEDAADLSAVDASLYLDRMKELEKGGASFMDVEKTDIKKRRNGAIIAAATVILFMLAMIVLIVWADRTDPAPKGVLIICLAVFGSIIVGVIIALRQRLREVKGGELDEARKY